MKPDYNKAQDAAEKIWKDLSLIYPPIPILEVVESFGLKVAEANFKKYSDISGVLDIEKNTIYLNEKDTAEHKRFTLAHELGHWILHKNQLINTPEMAIYYRRPIGGESDFKEKEANYFAANLLVPLKSLKEMAKNFSVKELSEIFAVSSQVIRYRLHFIKF